MYTPVTTDLHEQLFSLCQLGGVEVDASSQFTQSMQGRIHRVYLVQTQHAQFIIQCLNPQVIKVPSAFESLINGVLAPAALAPQLLHWPATGQCVLQHDSETWIRRSYIVGQAMTARLSLSSFESMASTLRHFHQSLTVADIEQSNFIGVNPWSGEATPAIENLYNQSSGITRAERAVVNEWAKYKQRYIDVENQPPATHAVVHRDAKPSNFIRKPDGTLALIDFDTIGIGDPALDLGELLRAWVSADELVNEIDSVSSGLSENSNERIPVTDFLAESDVNCAKAILALQAGYNDPSMTASRIHMAAIRCCLWQCERFLEDHFAGDTYYAVQAHGDNLTNAKQQLEALRLVSKNHSSTS